MPINPIPTPQAGTGTFGMVPGPIGMPNPAEDLSAQYPNLTGTSAAMSGDILAKLSGQITPGTMGALQTAAAQFGARSGMPGSGLQWNNLFGNIVGFGENQAQQGIQDYNATIPTVSGTQTVSPALQTEIAGQNALNRAAPTPSMQANYAQQLFNQYMSALSRRGATTAPSTSPAAGTGSYVQGPWASDRPNPPAVGPGAGTNPIGSRVIPPTAPMGYRVTNPSSSSIGTYPGTGTGAPDLSYNWFTGEGLGLPDMTQTGTSPFAPMLSPGTSNYFGASDLINLPDQELMSGLMTYPGANAPQTPTGGMVYDPGTDYNWFTGEGG